MICEKCKQPHCGEYGSGRFCSKKCACAYSTASKRQEINEKVSQKLTGRPGNGHGWKKGFDPRRHVFTSEEAISLKERFKKAREEKYNSSTWDDLPLAEKRRRIMAEQDNKCLWCRNDNTWNGKKITLELDHINGYPNDNRYENLRFLCPNCHSQTPTYRNSKRDEII
jgi:5-methylcytosine-specific restriction endonuclease McrA